MNPSISSKTVHAKDTTTDIKKSTAERDGNYQSSSAVGGSEELTANKKQTTFSNKPENDENLVTSEIDWAENKIDFTKKC